MVAVKSQPKNARVAASTPFVDNRELHHPVRLRKLLAEAERVVTATTLSHADDMVLFKAMHGCGYALDLNERKGRHSRREAARLHGLRRRIRDRLVNQHVGLVYEMRRRARLTDVDPDDLNSDGFLTLLRSITHFDPWRGYRFSTYACTSLIRAYLLLAHRVRRTAAHLNRIRDDALAVEGRRIGQDPGTELLVDRVRKVLSDNSADLTATERFVIERRLLNPPNGSPQTLAAIGQLFRLSKERVRQIQMGALRKLRVRLADDPAIGYPLPWSDSDKDDETAATLAEADRRLNWG